MRWKLKGNWNGADDKSLHTHSFSFGLNHFWTLEVASHEEKWEKGPYLKKPSVPDLLTYIFYRRTFLDRLAKTVREDETHLRISWKGLYLTLWYISFLLSGTICVFDPHLLFRTLTNFINLLSDKRKFSPPHEKFLVQIYHFLQMVL